MSPRLPLNLLTIENRFVTWVKICGITNLEDAQAAVEAGADALGFVFYEKSPRNIAPDTAQEIVRLLPSEVGKVGVFVDMPAKQRFELYNDIRLTAMQSYPFSQPPSDDSRTAYSLNSFWQPPKSYICFPMSFFLEEEDRVRGLAQDFARIAEQRSAFGKDHPAEKLKPAILDTIFLDAGGIQEPGGTGNTFDWNKALPLVDSTRGHFKVVVAGGLTPSNVAEAMRILRPWGVDVSSGVESGPGKKDLTKIRAFIDAVREADRLQ
jgi:phosphoribosylanthranilate isomerase